MKLLTLSLLLATLVADPAPAQTFDLVLRGGRVMDPESGLDATKNLGIAGGKIKAISEGQLDGRESIDAAGLVVAPGFIDLHQHAWDAESYAAKALDGVTSILELEVGTDNIEKWYAEREGKLPVHYGVSIGHLQVRMQVMKDFPGFLPPAGSGAATKTATPEDIEALKADLARGLAQGAPAVGFGLQYTPAAERWEIIEMFRIAAAHHAPCHVHMRFNGDSDPGNVEALGEVIGAAAITGAPLHIVHINSTGRGQSPKLLGMIEEARGHGLDISVECYPYTAGMTEIQAAMFNEGFRERMKIDYGDLQWGATGERLTAETFAKYRETGGLVIVHSNSESVVRDCVSSPLAMIASDGLKGHPRNYGTYARILGKYVREDRAIDLMTALKKMSLMPAQRLEGRVPGMKYKGRIKPGADADLVIFDPATVTDRSTFAKADRHSDGIRHLLVNGTRVVTDGRFVEGVAPGRPIRAPIIR